MAEKQCNLLKNGGGTDTLYSTTEHIVGKVNENGTIKDLYEITLMGTLSLTISSGQGTQAIPINKNISKVYDITGHIEQISSTSHSYLPWGFANQSSNQWISAFVTTTASGSNFNVRTISLYDGCNYLANIFYTKT